MRQYLLIGTALCLSTSLALAQTSFEFQDENADGSISKDEFYGSVSDLGVYADWDLDADGFVGEEEFADITDEYGYDWDYADWDADANGLLDAGEFYDGVYADFDDDESGHWDDGEWDDAGDAGLFDV